MLTPRYLLILLLIAFVPFSTNANSAPEQFTPLVAAPLNTNTRPFLGTDGRVHIVYELVLTNASATPATLKKIEVLGASSSAPVLASYDGKELLSSLKTTSRVAAESPKIEPDGTRLFLIDVSLDSQAKLPERLLHHIEVLGAPMPGPPTTPVLLSYTVAPLNISTKLPHIGPPLSGKGWVAANGCCGAASIHRSSSQTVNGGIYFAQRFAIDWMLLDASGRLVHGDPADVRNYTCYGAEVLAVADGTATVSTDPGRAMVTGKCADIGKFRVPGLRGLAARAPYFHSGTANTLMDVINFYDTRFNLTITDDQKADLVAFMNTL